MIWLALIIPIIGAIILWKYYGHKTTWWEVLLPMIATAFLISILNLAGQYSQTHDTEYWGGIVKKLEYYEDWNEYIDQTCEDCDDEGNCTTYDCSYVDYHSEYWQLTETNGFTIRISHQVYNKILNKLGGKRYFVDLHRDYHTNDGDKYSSDWDGRKVTAEPVTTEHSYTNKVQVARSTFEFKEVGQSLKDSLGLFDYPKIYGYYEANNILGNVFSKQAENELRYINGKYGAQKSVRFFILFFSEKDKRVAEWQEHYWNGGNQNEIVICVGLDKNKNIQWNRIFSWTKQHELTIEIRDYLSEREDKQMEIMPFLNFLETEIQSVRGKVYLNFEKVFDYLTVETPTWTIVTTYLFAVIVNLILGMWIVHNEHDEGGITSRGRYRYRNRY